MKILNFGSLNIDHVYMVEHFVRPGETLNSKSFQQFCGGKGLNQSVALAHAGAAVYHAGVIGQDGLWLKRFLERHGAKTSLIEVIDEPSGHAIIQVNQEGENSIILYGGANKKITDAYIEKVLTQFTSGDYLLLQNEINAVPEIIARAASRGLKIAFNPAPMDRRVLDYPLNLVSCFILNEIEGGELTGEQEAEMILASMREQYPEATTILTLGEQGVLLENSREKIRVPAEKIVPVDTTAAGDTFIGYFIASMMKGQDMEYAIKTANKAAALCATRPGAADSIPNLDEVENMEETIERENNQIILIP
ncbi:MAG: ribokinase [Deltaproteobacteria bacterium]|nr:ribokinase [Deltaproteobacteria bacterium]MBW2086248.1 ribokinase [Deltaproteobacteria bacterium]